MRYATKFGMITNKMVLIQALGPMSLFTEDADGPEISTQLCAKMIQLVHTVGLHHQRSQKEDDTFEVTALCCAWALDRLSATIHGRPTIMHERDISRELEECFRRQLPASQLLLEVLVLLDKVIAFYRPSNNNNAECDFHLPSFEDIIVLSGATNLPASIIGMSNLFYI